MVFAIHHHGSATGIHVLPPSWTPLQPPSLPYPSGFPQGMGLGCRASCLDRALVSYFTYGNAHVSMTFSQIIPPSPSPSESKSLFFMSVSLLLPCMPTVYPCSCLFFVIVELTIWVWVHFWALYSVSLLFLCLFCASTILFWWL